MLTLYHRTTAQKAEAILASGFCDIRGYYGTDIELEGVWISDLPLDADRGADGDALLAVTLDDDDLSDWAVVADDGTYREWLVSAALLNAKGKVRIVSLDEEQEAMARRWC